MIQLPCARVWTFTLTKHGRLKVKTTSEQQEAKRKEREKKLKLYNAGTQAAFSKRKKGEHDEEGLKITGEILAVNPDFYSLWNFRKEIYLYILDNRNKDEVQKMMEDELSFLETCLKVNPKSYGSWNHRCFVMDNMPKPDWARELHLRFVVERSNVNLEDELLFTTHKIQTNFSNYSSWHYRSKLLPLVYPDHSNPVGVQEEVLLKEYEVVQNAIFTDPDDQSAWFYHRWLLGRGYGKLMDIPDTIPGWSDMAVSVTLTDDSDCTEFSQGLNLSADQTETWVLSQEKSGTKFTAELSAAATSTLEKELESITELHNLEPENKFLTKKT
ncbi:hypothetical protein KUTeg_016570 [Tegillarca granosa]|uniref:Geranylgeranyl transferase type-2 subunit alpha n=1 Tax=Tegillarca granosa TaxID=220873 RepID=A0ABQ9ER35_TEGGR|nr:hypothetical protein KUTeg_016570 [Tegillarca granosa]